ncbi:hypothetical protein DYL61_13420 [Pseudomonas nabeulensis]|uniref:HNH nuclease domain-containing protein n=1 Tax=Pseudomonas nabeulensis TaxID=2293833 RepID=A0A4Z0B5A9_9PSED|nr:hypothetical protein [Pseudomonas nabeulensis]TFY93599.1 hypothetical protein DYL61_13420 [Pseudomonas nabeulensis]
MRYVNRKDIAEPDSLSKPSAAVKDEKDAAELFYATFDPTQSPRPAAFTFKAYKSYDVQHALRQLFLAKCAYCESHLGDSLEVEHFRPKGGVTEDPLHFGYWWLAHSWENLLPACPGCNKNLCHHLVTEHTTEEEFKAAQLKKSKSSYGKANQFPVSGKRATDTTHRLKDEAPDLLDPTVDDPASFLGWSRAGHFSVAIAKSSTANVANRALATINVFALNRASLVRTRTEVLTELRFQRVEILSELEEELAQGISAARIARIMRRVEVMRRMQQPEKRYSMLVQEFIDDFVAELSTHPGLAAI